jgi:malonyl-CoA O-methyltransferase
MLNKKIIANNFSKAASNYDKEAFVQNYAAAEICKIINPFIDNLSDKKIIDLGSGTSAIYKNFSTSNKSQFFEVDLSLAMLQKTPNKSSKLIVADIENLPIKNESFDIIISSFALQWLQDFNKIFSNFHKILKKDGILAFCIPTDETLDKLREASEITGCNFHFNKLPKITDLEKDLQKCGFLKEIIKSEVVKLDFNGAIEALKHFKKTGATYSEQKKFITKKQLLNFDQFYLKESDKFTFMWNISYLILRKI